MPAELGPRLQHFATFHNMVAEAYAAGCRGVSAGEVQEALGCERKAVYRIAADLRHLGAPLDYVMEEHLWCYRQAWNFPYQFVYTIAGVAGARFELDCLLDPKLRQDLEAIVVVDPALSSSRMTLPRLTGSFDPLVLGGLARAIKEHLRVSFDYRKPQENVVRRREAEPLGLFEWNGMIYLQAHERDAVPRSFKRFALPRMTHLTVTDEEPFTFLAEPVPQLSCLGAFCRSLLEATFEADKEHAPFVRERCWHPDQKNEERDDGGIRFTLPFGDYGEAARWILGMGPGFRPVAPAALVETWKEFVKDLSRAAEVY